MPTPSASRPGDVLVQDARDRELIVGEAVALDLRPTAFVLRAAGTFIDFLVYMGSYLLLFMIFSSVAASLFLDEALVRAISIVGLVIAIVIVPLTVETLTQGKSLGKLAVGARIVRDDGGAIGVRHAAIRALTGVLEIFFTLGGLAAIVALLDARSRRLGDMIAGTYSQNERVSQAATPVFGVPVPLLSWAATADAGRMPDGLSRRISQFLGQAAGLTPTSRARLASELANEAARYVSPVPATDPELFLAAVSAVRRDREFAALQSQQRGLERLAPVLRGLPREFPDRG
jgi:uncharacterized RDD family membrane protein YckC